MNANIEKTTMMRVPIKSESGPKFDVTPGGLGHIPVVAIIIALISGGIELGSKPSGIPTTPFGPVMPGGSPAGSPAGIPDGEGSILEAFPS